MKIRKIKNPPLLQADRGWKRMFLPIVFALWGCSPSANQDTVAESISGFDHEGHLSLISDEASPDQSLKILESYIGRNPDEKFLFEDIKSILLAQTEGTNANSSESKQKALELWTQAMSIRTSKEFSKIAFEGWLEAYAKVTQKILEPSIMTQLILAETQQGKISTYMRERNLNTHKKLLPILKKVIPQWLSTSESTESLKAPQGIPQSDPLLIETAKSNCQSQSLDISSWSNWSNSLEIPVRDYFNALTTQCHKKNTDIIDAFSALAQRLKRNPSTQPFALETLSRLAAMQRTSGLRREAAMTYVDLIEVWETPTIAPASIGLSGLEYYKKKINDLLWAARYRAMISDYEKAKIYAQKAIAESQLALVSLKSLTPAERTVLEDLKAESYHTLASRIAVEKRQWESAASLNLMGLESPHISGEWRFRMLWLAGLYEYIGGNFAKSRSHWEKCLNGPIEPAQTPMTLFWLSMAEQQLHRVDESREYLNQLLIKFPLSYYSTIAPIVAKLKSSEDIQSQLLSIFGNPDESRKLILSKRWLSVSQPRELLSRNSKVVTAMRRAEGINKLRNKFLMERAATEFESVLKQVIDEGALTPTEEEAALIYSARLFFASEKFLSTIGITHKIALKNPKFWQKWPEHVHVFFPKPFIEYYIESGREFMIEPETLLAISRQESGFTTSIESHAGALGLMQLMRPTAKKYASLINIGTSNIDDLLSEPKNNIKIGAKYLAELTNRYNDYIPAIFAGYNAGENAVDLWMKSRAHSDPLIFIELVPFGETKDYVKNVWRNKAVYSFLNRPKIPYKVSSN